MKPEAPTNCSSYLGSAPGFAFVYKVIFGDRFSEMAWRKPTALVKRFHLKERDFPRAGKFQAGLGMSKLGARLCFGGLFSCIFCIAWPLSTAHHASIFGCHITRKSIKVTAGPGGLPPAWWAVLPGAQGEQEGSLASALNCAPPRPSWGSMENPQTANQPNVEAPRWVGFHFQSLFPSSGDLGTDGAGHLAACPERWARAGTEQGAAPGAGALASVSPRVGAGLLGADPCNRPLNQPAPPAIKAGARRPPPRGAIPGARQSPRAGLLEGKGTHAPAWARRGVGHGGGLGSCAVPADSPITADRINASYLLNY